MTQVVEIRKTAPSKWNVRVVVPASNSKTGKEASWFFGEFRTKMQAIEAIEAPGVRVAIFDMT
jgi:hypothetical protein|tara:strand:+ start:79 stop:267 length:189 start_codon:yes stop_codon:yes gene_type:complete